MCTHIYTCIYTHTYVHTHIYRRIYTHTYVHTCTHTQSARMMTSHLLLDFYNQKECQHDEEPYARISIGMYLSLNVPQFSQGSFYSHWTVFPLVFSCRFDIGSQAVAFTTPISHNFDDFLNLNLILIHIHILVLTSHGHGRKCCHVSW